MIQRPNAAPRLQRLVRLGIVCAAIWGVPAPSFAESPPPPFVSETHLLVPKRVTTFTLEHTDHDPQQPLAGARFRYRSPAHPGATILLTVYAAGDTKGNKAFNRELQSMRDGYADAVKNGRYVELAKPKQSRISVDLPPRQASLTARIGGDSETTPAAQTDGKPKVESIRVSADSIAKQAPLKGQRIAMRFTKPGETTGAATAVYLYLFERHMHFYKVVLSWPADDAGPDTRDIESDRLVRELVATMETYNIGGCGELSTYLGKKVETGVLSGIPMGDLLKAMGEIDRRGCVKLVDADENALAREPFQILYRPQDWTLQ